MLVSELESGELHIYSRDIGQRFTLTDTMPVSIGKSGFGKTLEGDNKTPVGVYRITSHLTETQLDDFYGESAYPINYPNSWDRLHGRTGSGIWLHAEPIGTFDKTRPKLDSNGCVVLSNNDIERLQAYLSIGYTPVILTPKMEMVSIESIEAQRAELLAAIERWRKDWESLDNQYYLAHYSADFNNIDKNYAQWQAHKNRVNSRKRFIKVRTSDLSIYQYPDEDNLVQVDFYQSYRSSNYNADGWKRQLWRKEDDVWKIIYES